MRSIKHQNTKKSPVSRKAVGAGLAAIAVIVIALVAWQVYNNGRSANSEQPAAAPPNTVNYGSLSEAEQKEQAQRKDDIVKDQTPSTGEQDMTVTITRARQQTDGQPLNIRAMVDGASDGQCEMTLTQSGQPTIRKQTAIVRETGYSTCGQADIAMGEFAAGGEWQLGVVARSGGNVSPAATQTVTIKK